LFQQAFELGYSDSLLWADSDKNNFNMRINTARELKTGKN
jgi:hypothetical protein